MSFGGLVLSKKEKNAITKQLFLIIKNDRKLSPLGVKKEWALFFRGVLATRSRASNQYFISDHRPWLCKMCAYLAELNYDLDSTWVMYDTGETGMIEPRVRFNINWLQMRLREEGVDV